LLVACVCKLAALHGCPSSVALLLFSDARFGSIFCTTRWGREQKTQWNIEGVKKWYICHTCTIIASNVCKKSLQYCESLITRVATYVSDNAKKYVIIAIFKIFLIFKEIKYLSNDLYCTNMLLNFYITGKF